jgi:hypothetical protein
MKKNKLILFILFIVIVSTISYSIYIYKNENDELFNWLNTFFATIFSVSFAFAIAMYIFYNQSSLIEKKTKEKYLPLIEDDLISIWKGLANLSGIAKFRFNNGEEGIFHFYFIQDIIFEQSIISNVFNKTETEFLLSVRNSILYNNKTIENTLNMYSILTKNTDIYEEIIKGLIRDNIESRKEIKESIESSSKYFKFTKLENEIRNTKK